jgi:hypothetical protein
MVKHRFVDIATGDADLFAVFHIGNGAPADRLFDGFLDVVTVAPQKALAVHRALVLAIETSVDHIAHRPSGQLQVVSYKLQEKQVPGHIVGYALFLAACS